MKKVQHKRYRQGATNLLIGRYATGNEAIRTSSDDHHGDARDKTEKPCRVWPKHVLSWSLTDSNPKPHWETRFQQEQEAPEMNDPSTLLFLLVVIRRLSVSLMEGGSLAADTASLDVPCPRGKSFAGRDGRGGNCQMAYPMPPGQRKAISSPNHTCLFIFEVSLSFSQKGRGTMSAVRACSRVIQWTWYLSAEMGLDASFRLSKEVYFSTEGDYSDASSMWGRPRPKWTCPLLPSVPFSSLTLLFSSWRTSTSSIPRPGTLWVSWPKVSCPLRSLYRLDKWRRKRNSFCPTIHFLPFFLAQTFGAARCANNGTEEIFWNAASHISV